MLQGRLGDVAAARAVPDSHAEVAELGREGLRRDQLRARCVVPVDESRVVREPRQWWKLAGRIDARRGNAPLAIEDAVVGQHVPGHALDTRLADLLRERAERRDRQVVMLCETAARE